jgi:enterochelin esterase-like enzyme
MPEGDYSWWFNHARVAGSDGLPWGDYVWQDIVNYVDTNYRTQPRRESRAIGGLSAGGQSALMLAVTHPEVFSIAGGHSPSLRGADGSVASFGTPEYFAQYDLLWLAHNSNNWKRLSISIDVGQEDEEWGPAIQDFHQLLEREGVPHEFDDSVHGIHDSDYWASRLPDYLRWYSSKLNAN